MKDQGGYPVVIQLLLPPTPEQLSFSDWVLGSNKPAGVNFHLYLHCPVFPLSGGLS